jgi:hypothetical protein
MALCLLSMLAACGPASKPSYFLVPPVKPEGQFTFDLASVSRERGLNAHLGRAVDDKGHTLYVVEANGRGLRMWSQNVVGCALEGEEARPDQRQYVMYVQPLTPWSQPKDEDALSRQLTVDLVALGYQRRDLESPCTG